VEELGGNSMPLTISQYASRYLTVPVLVENGTRWQQTVNTMANLSDFKQAGGNVMYFPPDSTFDGPNSVLLARNKTFSIALNLLLTQPTLYFNVSFIHSLPILVTQLLRPFLPKRI